ncbi:glycosyltransferase family 4 protein [Cohnella herbarum]|uniref:Glycosyltransferase family 4 protein n=1 Tax=Cohnella herbarum TaxID=2728023 RepID=A0A7Z2VLI1_9BACL|nr:glycosyltransferase family 4 protein [Cohnella herbarum]QJD85254.1 glycosyltransferase family 4 protein [Cohnella herbarum]
MKPEVWIVNQYTVTPDYPASTRHYELAKYMSPYFDVTLWGSNFIHHNKTFRFDKRFKTYEETLEGFRMVWLASKAYKDNGAARVVNMLLYAATLFFKGVFRRKKPDVVIGSSPPLFAAFASWMIARCRGAKFVLEVRDLWPDSLVHITGDDRKFIVNILKRMERFLYRHSDNVIGLTEGIVEKLVERGVPRERVAFVPNGVDLETEGRQIADRNSLREKLGFAPYDKIIMYAGAHGPANNLAQLLEAMKCLQNETSLKLVLMGEGVEKSELIELAKQQHLHQVVFLPAVPKSDVQTYLSIADAYMICLKDIPLFEGALPNKLFDYMLQDKPIISTVAGEVGRFLDRHGYGRYGNMKEPEEAFLPTVIRSIMNHKPPKQKSSEYVRMHFSRKAQTESLAAMLQTLVHTKNR